MRDSATDPIVTANPTGPRDADDPKHGTPDGVSDDDFMQEVRDRYKAADAYWTPQFKKAEEDMRFAFDPEGQWDDPFMVASRAGRPMYTVNKLRQAIKQITNDQRMNRPQAKVRATEDGDRDLAEIRQGLLRNIEQQSTADRAYDTAFQFAVGGGYGVWRIGTKYADEGSFDQDIEILEVPNPYSVKFDASARRKDKRDARFCFVEEVLPRQVFRTTYPKADPCDFDMATGADDLMWMDEDNVRIVEYWYRIKEDKEIVLLSDGRVVDADEFDAIALALTEQGITETDRRTVEVSRVKQCICSGKEVLDGPNDWAGRFIPFVPVFGNIINIGGKEEFCGEVRYNKDAQRMYNYERSTFIEVLADQPYSPFMADAKSIEGYEKQYSAIRTDKPPVLLYNGDPNMPNGGKPSREMPPAFPAALANAAQISADDIKSGTGIYDASLGARSNETSGRAILARQKEGDVSSFDYVDNLAYAQKYSYEIIDDLIPHVLSTERQIRVIGDDGAEKVVKVNQATMDPTTGQLVTLNDLGRGRFDIAVTVGPSFTTQRMEAAEAMQSLANDPSPFGLIAKYGFLKALDAPGMEELLKGARKILVQQGLLEPEEGEQPPPQGPPPDPRAEADAMLKAAQANKLDAESAELRQRVERLEAIDMARVQAGLPLDGDVREVTQPISQPAAPPEPQIEVQLVAETQAQLAQTLSLLASLVMPTPQVVPVRDEDIGETMAPFV